MIIPRGTQPDKSLYAIGATTIGVLKASAASEHDLDDLYSRFDKKHSQKINFSYFLYAIDWLYLIGLVDRNEKNNRIIKCF